MTFSRGDTIEEARIAVKAQLTHCDMREAKLIEANLLRATGWDLALRAANLTGANLFKCHLTNCDLRHAVLRDAKLERASLDGCLVEGAEFKGAHGAILVSPINVGTPERPHLLEGEAALDWLRDAGADVTPFVARRQ